MNIRGARGGDDARTMGELKHPYWLNNLMELRTQAGVAEDSAQKC